MRKADGGDKRTKEQKKIRVEIKVHSWGPMASTLRKAVDK